MGPVSVWLIGAPLLFLNTMLQENCVILTQGYHDMIMTAHS